VGAEFVQSLEAPYRWRDWAAPPAANHQASNHQATKSTKSNKPKKLGGLGVLGGELPVGWKRAELHRGALGAFFGFVNGELIPHLKGLKDRPNATPRQKVISEIFSGVERTRIDTERNLLDVLDKVHEISAATVDPTHVFTLSQVYEGLLLKMG
jgi:type I restriction enzyme M protein